MSQRQAFRSKCLLLQFTRLDFLVTHCEGQQYTGTAVECLPVLRLPNNFLCFWNYTSCLTAPVSHENHMDGQNHTTLEWPLTWNVRWNTSLSSYICLLSSVATRSLSTTTSGFILIELISFMEYVLLILNFKVNIFSDLYRKCLTTMTKSFLLFNFYSLAFLRKAVRREIKCSGWLLWSGCHHQFPGS